MKQRADHRGYVLGILLAGLLLMVGCGGATTASTPATPPAVTIAITGSVSSLTVGSSHQFTATVSNTTNTAVTWSVNGTAGGDSNVGTISSGGMYTAPAMVPSPQAVTITATSQADASKSASVTVTINIILSLNVSTPVNVMATGTQQFSATVQGATNTAVIWAVNGVAGGNSSLGTISGDGLYTAPQVPPTPSTVTVSATSQAYSSITISIQVTITPPPISVTISPTVVNLPVSGNFQFTAHVSSTSSIPISPRRVLT